MKRIYCEKCKDWTEHTELDLKIRFVNQCNLCGSKNKSITLFKRDNPDFIISGSDFKYVTWDDSGKYKSGDKELGLNKSILIAPFSRFYSWLTTPITEIVSDNEYMTQFNTKNSKYILFKSIESVS